jgi:hypothetical protein
MMIRRIYWLNYTDFSGELSNSICKVGQFSGIDTLVSTWFLDDKVSWSRRAKPRDQYFAAHFGLLDYFRILSG